MRGLTRWLCTHQHLQPPLATTAPAAPFRCFPPAAFAESRGGFGAAAAAFGQQPARAATAFGAPAPQRGVTFAPQPAAAGGGEQCTHACNCTRLSTSAATIMMPPAHQHRQCRSSTRPLLLLARPPCCCSVRPSGLRFQPTTGCRRFRAAGSRCAVWCARCCRTVRRGCCRRRRGPRRRSADVPAEARARAVRHPRGAGGTPARQHGLRDGRRQAFRVVSRLNQRHAGIPRCVRVGPRPTEARRMMRVATA